MNARRALRYAASLAAVYALAACGGSPNTPNGSVVGSGGQQPPPSQLVTAGVNVHLPSNAAMREGSGPQFLSPHMQSLSISLASVNGAAAGGAQASIVDTYPRAKNCSQRGGALSCTGSVSAAAGSCLFNVTTYAGPNATGTVLSVGTLRAHIGAAGGTVTVSPSSSIAVQGVIAALSLALSPSSLPRGSKATVSVDLTAYDGSGAPIAGASDYQTPIALTIQGDSLGAYSLHGAGTPGDSVTVSSPSQKLTIAYDGNAQASSVTVQSAVAGPNGASANAPLALEGTPPPPPAGTVYVLNAGSGQGLGATVTTYAGSATGNVAPKTTLALSTKLYARNIAVDSAGNLYVGYLDSPTGSSPLGTPDEGNEIAVYAAGATGSAQPKAVITASSASKTALYPSYLAFDAAGDLVTYGSTTAGGNSGNAVLAYAPGSSGAATPASAWAFAQPTFQYPGPTGLALDASGNFYVNGTFKTGPSSVFGLYTNLASNAQNPASSPARTLPWDTTTQLTQGLASDASLDSSGEIYVANIALAGTSTTACQARANVFAAGATGGTTDVAPLRVVTLSGVTTTNPLCYSSHNNPLLGFYPYVTLYGSSIYVADEFDDAVAVYPGLNGGTVAPTQRISGSATGLHAPVTLYVSALASPARIRR